MLRPFYGNGHFCANWAAQFSHCLLKRQAKNLLSVNSNDQITRLDASPESEFTSPAFDQVILANYKPCSNPQEADIMLSSQDIMLKLQAFSKTKALTPAKLLQLLQLNGFTAVNVGAQLWLFKNI